MKLLFKIQYTLYWLRYGRPVAYGEPFSVPADWRARRKVLKDARHAYGFDLTDEQRAERFRSKHE